MTQSRIKTQNCAKLLSCLFAFFFVLFGVCNVAQAASLSVAPVIIDEKAKARDILEESVTLTNDTERKLNVYTFVNNVVIEEGKQEFLDPSRADQSSSLANWIMIRRGVIELLPGEKKKIDFDIEVNLRAKPGMYHALISFAEAPTRDDAEARIAGAPLVTVNLEVLEDIKERLQLKKFIPDKIFFSGSSPSFSYELENIGNQTLAPSGEIRIYSRGGEEVATIDANQDSAALDPNTKKQFASIWHSAKGFGRYKALINLEYGAKNAAIYDTVYFWIVPWQKILIIFGILALMITLITYFLHRKYERRRNSLIQNYTRSNTRKNASRPDIVDLRDIKNLKK